jgi:hypothetical protein
MLTLQGLRDRNAEPPVLYPYQPPAGKVAVRAWVDGDQLHYREYSDIVSMLPEVDAAAIWFCRCPSGTFPGGSTNERRS